MQNEKMVHMANQIAQYFSAYPEERGREGVLNHIRMFWEPRMRMQLQHYVEQGGEGLDPLVLWAVERLPEAAA